MALIGHQTMRQMMIQSYSIIGFGAPNSNNKPTCGTIFIQNWGKSLQVSWVNVPPSSRDIPGTWKSSDRSHGFREAQRPKTKGEAMEVAGRNLVAGPSLQY